MKKLLLIALLLGGCSTAQVQKFNQLTANFQQASLNFQKDIVAINADIAAVSPVLAKGCGDLQTLTMLLQPLATKGKGPQYFSAANGALSAYCTNIPKDISGTALAVASAVVNARAGYNNVKAQ